VRAVHLKGAALNTDWYEHLLQPFVL
jgi:hypothetical protein